MRKLPYRHEESRWAHYLAHLYHLPMILGALIPLSREPLFRLMVVIIGGSGIVFALILRAVRARDSLLIVSVPPQTKSGK